MVASYRPLYFCLCCASLMIGCIACTSKYVDFFPYYDDGRPKPCIAFLPMKDSSGHKLPWNVAEEITQGVLNHAKKEGRLYFISQEHIASVQQQLGEDSLLDKDPSYFKQFKGCDFIILSQLVEHREGPYNDQDPRLPLYLSHAYVDTHEVADLSMKVLIRVIDLRDDVPRLASQELISANWVIPAGKKSENYQQLKWGTAHYSDSFMKNAHDVLIKNLKERIEQISYAAPGVISPTSLSAT